MSVEIVEDINQITVDDQQNTVNVAETINRVEVTAGAIVYAANQNIIDLDYNFAYSTFYHELTFDGSGNLTAIDIWEDNTKTTALFTKVFTYTSGNLTGIVINDLTAGTSLTKALTYDGSGNLQTITRTYA